jgi:hypothetical protein
MATYLLDVRCQKLSTSKAFSSTSNLPNEFVEFLLAQNTIAVAFHSVSRRLLKDWLRHDTTASIAWTSRESWTWLRH